MLPAVELRTDQLISLIAFSCLLLLIGGLQQVNQTTKPTAALSNNLPVYSFPIQPIPVLQTDTSSPAATLGATTASLSGNIDGITATAAAVIDLDSYTVMYEKNSRRQLLPASTTKLMTALVARELYQLDEVITINGNRPDDIDDSSIDFTTGEQLTVESLLQAVLIQSSNEAAFILADHHPDGRTGFIKAMNQQAAELNLTDTHFTNVTGFDALGHHSSVRDLALLSQAIMADEVVRAIVRQPRTLITDLTGTQQHFLYSTNELLYNNPNVVGIKTGTTEGAGEVLITQVERDDRRILIIVMGSANRYLETQALIKWAFTNHQWKAFDAAD